MANIYKRWEWDWFQTRVQSNVARHRHHIVVALTSSLVAYIVVALTSSFIDHNVVTLTSPFVAHIVVTLTSPFIAHIVVTLTSPFVGATSVCYLGDILAQRLVQKINLL